MDIIRQIFDMVFSTAYVVFIIILCVIDEPVAMWYLIPYNVVGKCGKIEYEIANAYGIKVIIE